MYTVSNHYIGESMTNPMIPQKYRTNLIRVSVWIKNHVIIDCNYVVSLGVLIGEGNLCW